MRNASRFSGLWLFVLCLVPTFVFAQPDVLINEIRTDQPGGDVDEFFELIGPPGAPLDLIWYVVIGDGTGGSGVVEEAIPLFGQTLDASGYFVAAEATFSLGVPNLVTNLNFENNDNVTHLLVFDFFGQVGMDLDTNDDCVLDLTPWLAILDLIAIIEEDNPPTATECHYGPPTVGPLPGTMTSPGHVHRCPDGTGPFEIAAFDPGAGTDTPGGPNFCPQPPLRAFGFLHSALGQAQLDPAGGNLVVSNIGSSGKDGVSIDLGDPSCDTFLTGLELPPSLPFGSWLEHTAIGHLSGIPDSVLWTILAEHVGAAGPLLQVSVDASPLGSSTVSAHLFLDGQLVFQQSGLSGPLVQFPPPSQHFVAVGEHPNIGLGIDWHFPAGPIPVGIPGGPTITADRIVVTPDNPTQTVDSITHSRWEGQDVGSFTIFDEAIAMFPPDFLYNRALGESHLEPSGDTLTVANIGSSGLDGVRIDLGDVVGFAEAQIEPPDPASLTPGSTWMGAAIGMLQGGNFLEPVSWLTVEVLAGGQLGVTPDFSPLGASTFHATLFLDGDFVGAYLNVAQDDPFFFDASFPFYVAAAGITPWGMQQSLAFPTPLVVTTPAGTTYTIDQIVFDSRSATQQVSFLSSWELTAAGFPFFILHDEALRGGVPQTVPALGLIHTALGDAQLDPAGGGLTISNIGSSGKDGVSIDIGDPDCDAFFETIQLPAMVPPGAQIPHSWMGHVDGEPDSLVARLLAELTTGPVPALQLTPDFLPIGSQTYTIKLFLEGDLVFEQSGLFGGGAQLPPPSFYSTLMGPGATTGSVTLEYLVLATTVSIPGGPTILADRIVLCPDTQTANVTSITNMWLQGANIPSLEIVDEAIGLFQPNLFHHRADAEAHLEASGDTLTVSNIGSSGKDGVSIDVGETLEAFQADVHLPATPVDPGSTWTGEAWGQLAGTTFDQPFAMLWAEVLPQNQLQLTPDFSPIGSSSFTGRLYLQGDLVALWEGATEGVSFPIQPAYSPALAPTAWGAQAWTAFDQPVPVQLPNPGPGGPVMADTIVFDSENPTESVDFMSAVGLSAAGLPDFSIDGEITTGPVPPQTCDAVVQLSCAFDAAAQAVVLNWVNTDNYASIDIDRGGMIIATLPGNATSYTDGSAPAGTHIYRVVPTCDNGLTATAAACTVMVPGGITFIRGDADGDGTINFLADMLYLLTFGFLGGPPPVCMEAADVDDNAALNPLADSLYGLNAGFLGGPPPGAPYPACGPDPAPATSLGCAPNGCP